jgi:hypothetical protein
MPLAPERATRPEKVVRARHDLLMRHLNPGCEGTSTV